MSVDGRFKLPHLLSVHTSYQVRCQCVPPVGHDRDVASGDYIGHQGGAGGQEQGPDPSQQVQAGEVSQSSWAYSGRLAPRISTEDMEPTWLYSKHLLNDYIVLLHIS